MPMTSLSFLSFRRDLMHLNIVLLAIYLVLYGKLFLLVKVGLILLKEVIVYFHHSYKNVTLRSLRVFLKWKGKKKPGKSDCISNKPSSALFDMTCL